MMKTIIRATTTTEIAPDFLTGLSPVSLRNMIVEMRKAPCFLHKPFLSITLALVTKPSRRIDGRSMMTTFGQ
jgi:hypothetical protein